MEYKVEGRWIAAARWSGVVDLRPVIAALGGAGAFLRAPASALLAAGLSAARVGELMATPDAGWRSPWVSLVDPRYPAALLELDAPPPVVWWQGRLELAGEPQVAIVGARCCTSFGLHWADRVATAVARAGAVVVSGAARGIDTAAHRGALAADGLTVAVMGCGVEDGSVRRNPVIAPILAAEGLVLSEFPPRDPPTRWTFPRRNRLIAALGRATVVVEASERSGSLHTARFARDLGREVFAVPGRPDAPASAGALGLIAEGASMLLRPGDAVAVLGDRARGVPARLREALARPASVESVAIRAGLEPREALRMLLTLELTGLVRRLPDQRYAWI